MDLWYTEAEVKPLRIVSDEPQPNPETKKLTVHLTFSNPDDNQPVFLEEARFGVGWKRRSTRPAVT